MLISRAVNIIKDIKRITDLPDNARASRMDIWRSYFSLQRLPKGPGIVPVCGYMVSYLDCDSMRKLYRDIFIYRVYSMPVKSPVPMIIDCGSNIGMSLMFFKQEYPNARIIGFEPHPLVFRTLEKNVNRNALTNINLHQTALGETAGTTEFYVDQSQPGALNMSIFQGKDQAPINVSVDQLSRYIDAEVDLLKLDIEGAEELVLRDLAAHDKLQLVKHIVCEYHHHRNRGDDSFSRTLAILEQAGFGYHLSAYMMPSYHDQQPYQQDVILHAYRKATL